MESKDSEAQLNKTAGQTGRRRWRVLRRNAATNLVGGLARGLGLLIAGLIATLVQRLL